MNTLIQYSQMVFLPLISKPTRVTTSSATLIDHMYTNDITSSHNSGIIINDVADHFGTFCIFQGKLKKSKQSKIKKRSFKQSNVETFRRKLDAIDFTCIMNIDCPNIAYTQGAKPQFFGIPDMACCKRLCDKNIIHGPSGVN